MTALVMRFSETSPIEGYMAMSLSATYHCTAAVPATVLIMIFGKRYGNARRIEHTRLVPFAPPTPMAPAISPLEYLSSKILVPPWTITAAASWRERSSSACQDTPTASATCAPETSAADKVCDFIDRSTIQGVAPARVSASAMKRASLLFVSIVARTAMIGLDALKNSPALPLNHPITLTDSTARGS